MTGAVQAIVCPVEGHILIGTAEQQIKVVPTFEFKPCKNAIGKELNVKGVIKDYLVNEEFLAQFEESIEVAECPEMKEFYQQAFDCFKAKFEADGEYPIYYIEATEIAPKDGQKGCCKKEGKEGCGKESKEGCEKSCGEKKDEGCEKEGKKECDKPCDKEEKAKE
jgi:hypothetical protein